MFLGYILIGLCTAALFIAFLRLMDPFRSFPLHWLMLIVGVAFPLSLALQSWLLGGMGEWLVNVGKAEMGKKWLFALAAAGGPLVLQMVLFGVSVTLFKARKNPVVFLQTMGAISLGSGFAALWPLRQVFPVYWEGGLMLVVLAGQILSGQIMAYGWMSLKLEKAKISGIFFGLMGVALNWVWMAGWYWLPPSQSIVLSMGFLFFLLLSLLPQMFNNALNFSPKFDQRKGMDFSRISAYLIGGLVVCGAVIWIFTTYREREWLDRPLSGVYLWASLFVLGFSFLRWPKMRLVPMHWEKIRFQLIITPWEGKRAPQVFGGLPHGLPFLVPMLRESGSQLRISGPRMNEAYLDSLIGERVMLVPQIKQKNGSNKPVWVKVVGKQFMERDSSIYRAEVEGEEASTVLYLIPRYKRKTTKDDHYIVGILVPDDETETSNTFLEPSQFRFKNWVVLYDEAEVAKRKKEKQPH